jgi:hypothetical protein
MLMTLYPYYLKKAIGIFELCRRAWQKLALPITRLTKYSL